MVSNVISGLQNDAKAFKLYADQRQNVILNDVVETIQAVCVLFFFNMTNTLVFQYNLLFLKLDDPISHWVSEDKCGCHHCLSNTGIWHFSLLQTARPPSAVGSAFCTWQQASCSTMLCHVKEKNVALLTELNRFISSAECWQGFTTLNKIM